MVQIPGLLKLRNIITLFKKREINQSQVAEINKYGLQVNVTRFSHTRSNFWLPFGGLNSHLRIHIFSR